MAWLLQSIDQENKHFGIKEKLPSYLKMGHNLGLESLAWILSATYWLCEFLAKLLNQSDTRK